MSITPAQPPTVMNWLRYNESLAAKSGIYMLVIADGFVPFYAGTALSFASRLYTHKRGFCTGQRTFFRPAFIAGLDPSPEAIMARWKDVLGRYDFRTFVHVPDTKPVDDTILREGSDFWDGLIKLVCSCERKPEEAEVDYRRRLKRHEFFLQKKMEHFYEELIGSIDFRIPKSRSMLFGRRECSGQEAKEVEDWSVHHAFNTSCPTDFKHFFTELPQVMQQTTVDCGRVANETKQSTPHSTDLTETTLHPR